MISIKPGAIHLRLTASPWGLLESCAVNSCLHGSEGAGTQQCVPVYFCEPASPWQRGSNENTNGLLRQYFPKSTDLSIFSAEDLAFVAAELNSRPRRTLGWQTPADLFAKLVATLE